METNVLKFAGMDLSLEWNNAKMGMISDLMAAIYVNLNVRKDVPHAIKDTV